MAGIPIYAQVGGTLKRAGVLTNGTFYQRIDPRRDILRKAHAAGVDDRYFPPLSDNVIICHDVVGRGVFQMRYGDIKRHPQARLEQVGPKHPPRWYLDYKYWGLPNAQQLTFEWAAGDAT